MTQAQTFLPTFWPSLRPFKTLPSVKQYIEEEPDTTAQTTSAFKVIPNGTPTYQPTGIPTTQPTVTPTGIPTGTPTCMPTGKVIVTPTGKPKAQPIGAGTTTDTIMPTVKGTPTGVDTDKPTGTSAPTATFFPTSAGTGITIPAWASGPSEILRYFTCSGSPVQDRGFESLRNFRKGRL